MLPEFARSRRFAPLFVTQFLGALNDNLFKTTLLVMISFYGLGKSALLPASQLLNLSALLFVLPYFLFSALAGQLSAKYNKANIARCVKIMEIIIMILATYGFYLASTPLLMLCIFLMGTHSTIFGPLKYSVLPEYLHSNELVMGNGLIESGTFLAILFGQILGTSIAGSSIGLIGTLIILVAVFGFSGSLFMPAAPIQTPNAAIDWNIWRGTKQLLRETFAQKELATAIIGISWFWFIGAVYTTQLPTFVQMQLGGDDNVFNLILTLFSIGIAGGSILCAKLSKGQLKLSLVGLAAIGLGIVGSLLVYCTYANHFNNRMGLWHFLSQGFAYPVILLMTAIGFFGGFFSVPLYTWLQTASVDTFRSQAIAANNIINGLFMVAAAIISAILLKIFDNISILYLIVALGNFMVLIYLIKRVPNILRDKC